MIFRIFVLIFVVIFYHNSLANDCLKGQAEFYFVPFFVEDTKLTTSAALSVCEEVEDRVLIDKLMKLLTSKKSRGASKDVDDILTAANSFEIKKVIYIDTEISIVLDIKYPSGKFLYIVDTVYLDSEYVLSEKQPRTHLKTLLKYTFTENEKANKEINKFKSRAYISQSNNPVVMLFNIVLPKETKYEAFASNIFEMNEYLQQGDLTKYLSLLSGKSKTKVEKWLNKMTDDEQLVSANQYLAVKHIEYILDFDPVYVVAYVILPIFNGSFK